MPDLLETLRAALAGRYAVERELGRGGMATVFLAQDEKHHRPVAIKVLHAELAAALGPERFLREIEIAARLQHPHILPLYDSGSAAGLLYYVMPYVEGESLRDRLNREKQLGLEDTLRITAEVAGALAYAHTRGVVHRDIKPENIMLSGGTAVVADFGIARAVTAAEEGQQLTQTGTIIGTPAYMSPEQATGSQEIDGRSDEYSLACVVYEMLVGEPPFTGPTARAIIARHSLDDVSPPSIVRATIPDALEDALLRALAKVPADRYSTTTLFAEALQRPSSASGTRRRTTATGLRPRRTGVRARALGLAGGAVVLALVLWGARAVWRSRSPGAAAGYDPRRIAVLYFDDRSPNATLAYLADGLTDALIHELAGVPTLQVISRNGVAPFRHARLAQDSIARALRVGTLVNGTVELVRDSVRVTVSMTDARTGAEVGSTTLQQPRGDVFALEDSIAGEVSIFLRQELGAQVQHVQALAETHSAEAWRLLQLARETERGVDTLVAAGDTAGARRELVQADSLLAGAAALDPRWPAPVVERGWVAYLTRRIVGLDKAAAPEWIDRGLGFAESALKLKPGQPEALQLRGTLRYWKWLLNLDPAPLTAPELLAAAEADLRAGGAAGNPNRAGSLALLSHLLLRKSETAEGKLAALEAYEADPYLTDAAGVLWRLFSASLDLEDGTEASKWCREGYGRFPRDPFFTECQILVYALKGQRPDVPHLWRLLDADTALYAPNQRPYRWRRGQLLVAFALVNAGLKDSARSVARRARADATIDPTRDLVYISAMLENQLGDRDEALRLLTEYLATNPEDRSSVAHDQTWWWRGLRDDPRFKALVGT